MERMRYSHSTPWLLAEPYVMKWEQCLRIHKRASFLKRSRSFRWRVKLAEPLLAQTGKQDHSSEFLTERTCFSRNCSPRPYEQEHDPTGIACSAYNPSNIPVAPPHDGILCVKDTHKRNTITYNIY